MSKKSEDNLESFFRKAVNQSDSSFMEQDWEAMEKKLDEDPITGSFHQNRARNRKIAVTTTAMAVLFAAYFFTIRTDQTLVGEQGSTNRQAAAAVEVPKQEDLAKEENQTADLLLPITTPDNNATDAAERPVANFSVERSIPSEGSPRATISEGAEATRSSVTDRTEPVVTQTDLISAVINESANSIRTTSPESQSITSDRNEPPVDEVNEQASVMQGTTSALSEEIASEISDTREADDSKKSNVARWNIALAIAPDFSTTSLRKYSSPGNAIGVLVGYQLHKRISINIGLMRSSKRYSGYGNDYQPPYGYWKARTNGIVPNEIYGSCRVLEIPVIIQYDILQRSRSRLFAGGGISTYLMSREEYQYSFSAPNPGADMGWSSEGATSSYPLAIGHFSFGYERQISPQVNVGIEPFLKVPFSGIGWSDIQLFTTGAFVNIRYRIARSPGSWSSN